MEHKLFIDFNYTLYSYAISSMYYMHMYLLCIQHHQRLFLCTHKIL